MKKSLFQWPHVVGEVKNARHPCCSFDAENGGRACAELLSACERKDQKLGIVNHQFISIHSQRRIEEPECVVKLIEAYFKDVEVILSDLSNHADDESNVDLTTLSSLAREIEDKSKSIGAELVKLACTGLIEACDENHRRKFDRSLMWVTSEFSCTKTKLEPYVRMERRIVRYMESRSESSSSSSS